MRRVAATLALAVPALALAACGSSSPAATPAAGTAATSPAAAQPAAATPATPAAGQAAAPLDPCQLVTRAEASSLAGTAYGPGQEDTYSGGKRCVYGSDTTNVFTVETARGTSTAAAQADWSSAQAQAQAAIKKQLPAGVTLSVALHHVPGLADRAALLRGSTTVLGHTIGFSGIYLLKGATFVAFQDLVLGHAAPGAAAMESEARTALGRVS